MGWLAAVLLFESLKCPGVQPEKIFRDASHREETP
jgi:hypothetical protein